jgi:hypothetical protein
MRLLRHGARGADVRAWQNLLRAKGYQLEADGVFGQQTLNATKAAQTWAGVTVDGIVGPATWKAVREKKRTRRPAATVRNVVQPLVPGLRPKIVDARNGGAGFPRHRKRRWAQRSLVHLQFFVGHYTGGPGSFLADARFQVTSPYLSRGGAPAIAYHIGVDLDGTVFVFNSVTDITWHCAWNTRCLGIVGRGGGAFTLAQRNSLRWVYKALQAGTFGHGYPKLELTGTVHRHVTPTSCPGPNEPFYRTLTRRYSTSPRG